MHFCVKKLSRLKKSEGKTQFSIHFSDTHSHGDNLQGFIARETKDQGDLRKNFSKAKTLKKRKELVTSREFSVISRAKSFANSELRLCLGRNFREKCRKTQKSRKVLPAKVSAPKVDNNIDN